MTGKPNVFFPERKPVTCSQRGGDARQRKRNRGGTSISRVSLRISFEPEKIALVWAMLREEFYGEGEVRWTGILTLFGKGVLQLKAVKTRDWIGFSRDQNIVRRIVLSRWVRNGIIKSEGGEKMALRKGECLGKESPPSSAKGTNFGRGSGMRSLKRRSR